MRRCRQSSSGSSPRRWCRPVGLPLPEAIDHGVRKPVAELPRQQNDLPAVMRLVRHEVREDVPDVERQVAPHVAAGRRHVAARRQSEFEETFDAVAAAPQSRRQLPARDMTTIDAIGDRDAVLAAKRPDPAAARIVQMGGDHPYCAPRGTRHGDFPQSIWQLLNQASRHLVAGSPGRQQRRSQIRPRRRSRARRGALIHGRPHYFAGVWSSLRNRAALL